MTYVITQWGVAHRAHPESPIATWCGRMGVKSITHTDRTLADFARDAGAEACWECVASLNDATAQPARINARPAAPTEPGSVGR